MRALLIAIAQHTPPAFPAVVNYSPSHENFQAGVRALRLVCEHWGIRDPHEAARRLYPLVAEQTNDEERELMIKEYAYPVQPVESGK